MSLSIGEWTGLISTVGMLCLGIWTAVGKGRESAQTQEERKRQQLREAEKERESCQDELAEKSRNIDTLLDFLRDIVGDSYTLEWIRKRAAALLQRMEP